MRALGHEHYELGPIRSRFTEPAEVLHPNDTVEVVAKAIYEQWSVRDGYTPWQDGGNSHMQTEARSLARAALSSKP